MERLIVPIIGCFLFCPFEHSPIPLILLPNQKAVASFMNKWWWKILCIVLLIYTIIGGFLFTVPKQPFIEESIRNLYFHVCMWFAMMILFTVSVVQAVLYLRTSDLKHDNLARQYAVVGIVFGVLGYLTGWIWASFTWADPNKPETESFASIAKDPKLVGAAIALLIYFAYLILRDSIQDIDKKARVSCVYNIYAFAFLFPSIWIVPRLLASLHPGGQGDSGGNPGLNPTDLNATMRLVFYPAIIGWTLLGVWIVSLKVRMKNLQERKYL